MCPTAISRCYSGKHFLIRIVYQAKPKCCTSCMLFFFGSSKRPINQPQKHIKSVKIFLYTVCSWNAATRRNPSMPSGSAPTPAGLWGGPRPGAAAFTRKVPVSPQSCAEGCCHCRGSERGFENRLGFLIWLW